MAFPPDFIVPVTQRTPFGMVPTALAKSSLARVASHQSVDDLVKVTGRDHRPGQRRNIVLFNPDSRILTVLVADGETEMAEFADMAHEQIEGNAARAKSNGRAMDFAAYRERAGLPTLETAGERLKDAVAERVAKHKRNRRTDPFRKVTYPDTKQTKFFMGAD